MSNHLEGKSILIVDDEVELLDVLALNLEIYGAVVYKALNGSEALEVVKAHKVDFILSDVRMPKTDGIKFLKDLRALYPHPPPFFFLTGFASEYSTEEMKALGANDMLQKPFSVLQIIELIKSTLNQK